MWLTDEAVMDKAKADARAAGVSVTAWVTHLIRGNTVVAVGPASIAVNPPIITKHPKKTERTAGACEMRSMPSSVLAGHPVRCMCKECSR